MKCFKRGEKGFTLVELLIVVAILGILAAVVIPNVVGLMGRGGAQAYETDQEVIQLAAATFYSDVHGGYNDNAAGPYWGCVGNNTSGEPNYVADLQDASHFYPTALAYVGLHTLELGDAVDPDNVNNHIITTDGTAPAIGTDIEAHAIWMGLVTNAPGSHVDAPASTGYDTRGTVSVLAGETGLLLQEMPESAMSGDTRNGADEPGGGYCWVVGLNGTVYGAYSDGTSWYNGFSGAYP